MCVACACIVCACVLCARACVVCVRAYMCVGVTASVSILN